MNGDTRIGRGGTPRTGGTIQLVGAAGVRLVQIERQTATNWSPTATARRRCRLVRVVSETRRRSAEQGRAAGVGR